jgi:hypothetical protein
MPDKWLVFGGWSLPPEILSPVFGDSATYIDLNPMFCDIIINETLKENWNEIIFNKIKQIIPRQDINIAGWSTGAFIAFALSGWVKPQKMALLSASPSFCKRDGFIFGPDRSVVKAMRRQLRRNRISTLENFHEQCGLNNKTGLSDKYSVEELDLGLQFLEHIFLFPLQKPLCPTLLFHGKEDAIIPWRAGEFFAREIGATKTILSGGHVFFLDDSNTLSIRNALIQDKL